MSFIQLLTTLAVMTLTVLSSGCVVAADENLIRSLLKSALATNIEYVKDFHNTVFDIQRAPGDDLANQELRLLVKIRELSAEIMLGEYIHKCLSNRLDFWTNPDNSLKNTEVEKFFHMLQISNEFLSDQDLFFSKYEKKPSSVFLIKKMNPVIKEVLVLSYVRSLRTESLESTIESEEKNLLKLEEIKSFLKVYVADLKVRKEGYNYLLSNVRNIHQHPDGYRSIWDDHPIIRSVTVINSVNMLFKLFLRVYWVINQNGVGNNPLTSIAGTILDLISIFDLISISTAGVYVSSGINSMISFMNQKNFYQSHLETLRKIQSVIHSFGSIFDQSEIFELRLTNIIDKLKVKLDLMKTFKNALLSLSGSKNNFLHKEKMFKIRMNNDEQLESLKLLNTIWEDLKSVLIFFKDYEIVDSEGFLIEEIELILGLNYSNFCDSICVKRVKTIVDLLNIYIQSTELQMMYCEYIANSPSAWSVDSGNRNSLVMQMYSLISSIKKFFLPSTLNPI